MADAPKAKDNPAKSAVSFAPKDRAGEADRRPFRASILFISLGLVMTSITVLWLGFFSQQDEIRLKSSDIKINEIGEIELTGAVYRGQTARGEDYEITAAIANERSNGVIDMSDPTARVVQTNGDVMNLVSKEGVYFPDTKEINLDGDVVITSADLGLKMLAQTLSANLTDGDMVSTKPVRVERQDGFVVANGMQVYSRGERIIFIGNAKMTLNNSMAPDKQTAADN